ncbi:MAG: DsbA family protein [Halioglobus sp.]
MPLHPLQSDRPVIVYIDFKSPYAYLAVEPTRALERELGVEFDWRPFVLDIPSYLGSAKLDKSGKVAEQNRSAEQWSGVKYAYFDCRRYASLSGKTIRGTVKIWDTNLVATAMLWVRQYHPQSLHAFIDAVYVPFWKRELDVENEQVIESILDGVNADGPGFIVWAHAEGLAQNAKLQTDAFDAGVYGVPTYVVGGERLFGREHLPRVGWHVTGQKGSTPDIAYSLPSSLPSQGLTPQHICVGVDDSLDSLLALPQLEKLFERHGVVADWFRIAARKPGSPPPTDDLSRSASHKRLRTGNRQADLARYTPESLSAGHYQSAIDETLKRMNIELQSDGPEQLARPALPGIAVMLDEELFIGRQHLPLTSARLDPNK